ncbi:MAG TPA: hypothetical protein PK201_07570 [Accumulibacter sp.]|nr:hypothetical protein [Accumulibacter sp.]
MSPLSFRPVRSAGSPSSALLTRMMEVMVVMVVMVEVRAEAAMAGVTAGTGVAANVALFDPICAA